MATIACAWSAVGIEIAPMVSPDMASVVCSKMPSAPPPPLPPAPSVSSPKTDPDCAAHPDAWLCDPANPASAFGCRGGVKTGTITCADLAATCRPLAKPDTVATVDPDGSLVCD